MKLRYLALLGTLTLPALGQSKPKPATPPAVVPTAPTTEPTVAELKRELAIEKVKTAIAQAQAAEAFITTATQQATEQAKKMDKIAQELIISTQRDLGLDSRYEWNMQAQNYVMKPQAGQPEKR